MPGPAPWGPCSGKLPPGEAGAPQLSEPHASRWGGSTPRGGGCSSGLCTSLHTLVHPCTSLCILVHLCISLHVLAHPCISFCTLAYLSASLHVLAHPCTPLCNLHTLVHHCASCSTPVARLHPSTIPFRPGWVGSMMQKASVFCYEYLFFSLYFFFGQTKTFLQGMTVTDYICQGFYQAIERAGDFWKPNK